MSSAEMRSTHRLLFGDVAAEMHVSGGDPLLTHSGAPDTKKRTWNGDPKADDKTDADGERRENGLSVTVSSPVGSRAERFDPEG
jgi:hypothetical protein